MIGIGIIVIFFEFCSRAENLWIKIFECRKISSCARGVRPSTILHYILCLIFVARGCLTRAWLSHKASRVFLLLQVNSDLFILSQKSMLFFDMRTSSETLYTSLLGVADCYFVLLTAGDRMSDLHGFAIDLEELSPPFPPRS